MPEVDTRPRVGPAEILAFAAGRFPHKVGLVAGGRRLTYAELDASARRVSVALRDAGIGAGDVVSLYGQNSWQWVVSYHGILRAGAVANPVNVMLTGPELEFVLRDCEARAVFVGHEQTAVAVASAVVVETLGLVVTFADEAISGAVSFDSFVESADDDRPAVARPRPTDLCSIGYTSGTTGHPKGAMQSHQAVLLNCAYTAAMHGRTADDVVLTALPAPHVYGNVAINSTFLVGGTVVLMERFDAGAALRAIQSERATMFEGVPAMYSMMLAHNMIGRSDLTSIRVSTVGGQTFPPSVLEEWQALTGKPMLELWGMTEIAGLGATHTLYAPGVPGSIGVSLPGTELCIRALDGSGESPVGEAGELMVRGPLVMLGYYRNVDATDEVLQSDGWLRTGDIATVDSTGHYFVVDRMKDMLITGGYNVYPAEIERVVGAHPDVAMVAVGRRPDDVRGEVAVAYVVAKAGTSPTVESILQFCKADLAAYKRPRDVVFIDDLPKTSSGKLMRRKLFELDPAPANHQQTMRRTL
ncbi:MAG: AMP-binding protein [Rhodococcus sp. (in: high G+C Gram-positive bacteria)]